MSKETVTCWTLEPSPIVRRRMGKTTEELGELVVGRIPIQGFAEVDPVTRPRSLIMEHKLKTDPAAFDDVVSGKKKFEIRLDDRGYQANDFLILRKTRFTGTEMKEGAPLEYVGPSLYFYVTYIMRGPIYGLADGWVIMTISPRGRSNG